MENRKKKLIERIAIGCLVIIIIELLIMVTMKVLRERKIERIDNINDIKKISDGYIAVGESDFNKSKFVNSKNYEYTTTDGNKQNIIATMARIAKYDSNMNLIWENTFESDYDSDFYSVISVDDGFIAVGSFISNYEQIELNIRDALIVKYDLNGKMVWKNTYSVLSDTEFYKIIDDGDNNYVIVGQSIYENMEIGTHITGGGIIVRINSDGEITSHNNYGGNKSGVFNDIIKVSDGYIVTGKDSVNCGILVKFKKDFNREESDNKIVSKKVLWNRTYYYTDNVGFTGMTLVDNKIYTVGAINISDEKDENDNPNFKYQAGIVVYNLNGKYVGKYLFDEEEHFRFTSVTSDNENLYLTLLKNVDKYGDDVIRNSMLVKYDLSGKIINKRLYSDNNRNNLLNKIIKIDNKYIVVGTTNDNCSLLRGCDYTPIINEYNSELK